jgi:hypothetical protein
LRIEDPMTMSRTILPTLMLAVACAGGGAQKDVPLAPVPATMQAAPDIGTMAPNFLFTPITKAGIGKSTKLSDLRGQTVVVWFFPKARTRG